MRSAYCAKLPLQDACPSFSRNSRGPSRVQRPKYPEAFHQLILKNLACSIRARIFARLPTSFPRAPRASGAWGTRVEHLGTTVGWGFRADCPFESRCDSTRCPKALRLVLKIHQKPSLIFAERYYVATSTIHGGSRYPVFEVSGSKMHRRDGILSQKPQIWDIIASVCMWLDR